MLSVLHCDKNNLRCKVRMLGDIENETVVLSLEKSYMFSALEYQSSDLAGKTL